MGFMMDDVAQGYVVKAVKALGKTSKIDGTETIGTLLLNKDSKAITDKNFLMFNYIGIDGIKATDKIQFDKIKDVVFTEGKAQRKPVKEKCCHITKEPYVGIDYVLKLVLKGVTGPTEEDPICFYGTCVPVAGQTKAQVIKQLALGLAKSVYHFGNYVDIYLANSADDIVFVDSKWKEEEIDTKVLDAQADHIVVREVRQPFSLGLKDGRAIDFDFSCEPIKTEDEYITSWIEQNDTSYSTYELYKEVGKHGGALTKKDGIIYDGTTAVGYTNGREMAEYEYFLLGMRADIYRQNGFPYLSPSKCIIDDTTKEYSELRIRYYFNDWANPEKSNKEIVFIIDEGQEADVKALLEGIVEIKDRTEHGMEEAD